MDQGTGSFGSPVDSFVANDPIPELHPLLKDLPTKWLRFFKITFFLYLSQILLGFRGCSSSNQVSRKGPCTLPSQNEPPKHVSEQQIVENNGTDNSDLIKSLSLEAAKELSERPKTGVIHGEATLYLESIRERLEQLSKTETDFSIDEAIEISDATCLLKILKRLEDNIEKAGQMAHSGALLILQADIMAEKGNKLLARSKRMLQLANYPKLVSEFYNPAFERDDHEGFHSSSDMVIRKDEQLVQKLWCRVTEVYFEKIESGCFGVCSIAVRTEECTK